MAEIAPEMTSEMGDVHGSHAHEGTGVDNRKLGMWVFLSSEFLFFGALITNYLLFKGRPGFPAPYPRELYDIPFTSVSSFVLLMSSLTMVLGSQRPGERRPTGDAYLAGGHRRCSVPRSSAGSSSSSASSSQRA